MNNKQFLPIGMVFQYLFTVCGGGMLIAGLITGFYYKWDMGAQDNKSRVALLMVIIGAVSLALGILAAVILYKVVVLSGKETPDDTTVNREVEEENKTDTAENEKELCGAQISESDRL